MLLARTVFYVCLASQICNGSPNMISTFKKRTINTKLILESRKMQTLTTNSALACSAHYACDDYRLYRQSSRFERVYDSISIELPGTLLEAVAVCKIVLRAADFTLVTLAGGDIVCYRRSTVLQEGIGLKFQFSGLLPDRTQVTISWHQIVSGALASQIDKKKKSSTAAKLLELIQDLWLQAQSSKTVSGQVINPSRPS